MNEDNAKIAQLEKLLQTQDLEKCFVVMSIALSIEDEEDRNLSLLKTVRWLLQNRLWQQAYGAAQMMSESYEKCEALQTVAEHLAAIGHLEKAFTVFEEAEKQAQTESLLAWQQAERLHHIAQSLRSINAFFKADDVWEKAIAIAQKGQESQSQQDSLDASSVFAEVAIHFASLGRMERALRLGQQIKNVPKREKVLLKISEAGQQIKQVA